MMKLAPAVDQRIQEIGAEVDARIADGTWSCAHFLRLLEEADRITNHETMAFAWMLQCAEPEWIAESNKLFSGGDPP